MAVLARLKIAPNQRLDLPDVLAFDSYAAGDWKYFLNTLTGGKAVIVKGFEIYEPNTLIGNPAGNVSVIVADSSLWWPNGSEGSFYASLPTEANRSVTLITNATNYVEMTLTLSSRAEDARALWDPGANGGAGGEFTQVIDTELYLDIEISRNNTGFSSNKIPLAKIVVNSSNNIQNITDCRPLLFRLGSGGTNPDPVNNFSWKDEPLGYSRIDTAVTMTSPTEENVFRGADKNITNLKDWMDAVMTRIKELAGQPKWFAAAPGSPSMPLSLSQLFLDSQFGHSIQPDRQVSLAWSKNEDGKLRSENAVGVNKQITWKANFGQLSWSLGGSFVSASNREYSDFTFEKSVSSGENLYLSLERDATINGDPVVTFKNISGSTAYVSAASTGAFSGVAVGDYIRKASSAIDQYYKIQELRVNAGTPFADGTTEGTVANATVQYIVLSTHDGPISETTEKFKYFRSRYQTDDLFTDTVGDLNPNYYWLGRRNGDMFYLRDYGDMQPGEEVETLNDSETQEHGGSNDLTLERADDSVYDPASGYALKSGGLTTLLTIRRRLLDNTIGAPSGVDNSDASLTYIINAPIGTIPNSFGLWVRLGDSSGALSSGDVTNVATDNVWEIRDPIDNPLRTYDNRNVYLIARKFTISGVECLIFSDGTMMSFDGQWINNHLSVQSDLFLKSKTQWSVPFIGTAGGRVDENNAEFFWNNTSGNDSLGVLGVRNLRITEDTANNRDVIDQDVAQDHYFLPNIGSKTIRFGNSNSTVHIPGDLVVDGNSAAINTVILQSDDKIISMGVGNLNDGGYGSGFEVADNTKNADALFSATGQAYIDVSYSSGHGYSIGDELNVDSNVACGGITAGQMNGSYTVVASASSPGHAEVLSSTSLRIYTNGTATSSANVSLLPPITQVRTYTAPWSVRLGSSDGVYTGTSSWIFRVKNQATTPTLTPVSSYGIVPTAHSSNMQAMRIPFVNDDNVGPSGADTTINFTGNLTWNNSTTTLTIGGDVVPMTDNAYDIGKYNLRWKTFHVGPGSVVVHNDITDINKITLGFTGSTATLISNSATPINIAVSGRSGVNFDIGGRLGVFGATDSSVALNVTSASPITSGTTQTGMYLNMPLSGTSTSENLKLRVTTTLATTEVFNLKLMNTVAGSSLSNQYGLYIDNLTGANRNIGIYSFVSAGTDSWNIYSAGLAQSYFAGNVGIGIEKPTAKLNVVDSGTQDAVRITQTGTGNAFVVEDSANPDSTPFVIDASGNVGIGTSSPQSLFNVGSSSQFQVNLSGDIVKLKNITYSWPSSQGAANTSLMNDGSGNLSWTNAAYWAYKSSTVTTNYSVLASDMVIPISTTANSSDITMTLPTASSVGIGKVYIFKDVGGQCSQSGKRIIIARSGSDTIDGDTTLTMENDYVSFTLVSSGSAWSVV